MLSRSLNRASINSGLVPKVAAGDAPVRDLFDTAQQDLVAARFKDIRWESLKRYGPVETQVWKKLFKFEGFTEPVTVELWQLRKDGKSEQILEVSTKAVAETDAHARALAKQFFAAARSAGLGEPASLTKTKKVMDFLKPGR